MKIRLLCVGKPRDAALARLHDRYAERVVRLGVSYESESVPEVQPGGRFSDDHVRQREARLLLERRGPRGMLIALDRRGKMLDTAGLAQQLERWATPCATIAIGGPLGLHASFVGQADATWSLSALTFPHELVRVLAAEQLYRAITLQRGLPYHK